MSHRVSTSRHEAQMEPCSTQDAEPALALSINRVRAEESYTRY